VLVYDTGPRHGSFDAGRSVVARYLLASGYRDIDTVVVSHGDADHAGGLPGLLAEIPAARVIAGGEAPAPGQEPCFAGKGWEWDGVSFAFVHPPPGRAASGNAGSCVLRVSAPGGSVLLPGDVGVAVEAALLRRDGAALQADLVVAPHHGSRTSSSPGFVAAVGARYVVYSTGHRNRFGFPHPDVAGRYRVAGARAFDTGREGAVVVRVEPGTGMSEPMGWRRRSAALWRTPANDSPDQRPR